MSFGRNTVQRLRPIILSMITVPKSNNAHVEDIVAKFSVTLEVADEFGGWFDRGNE